MGKIRMLNDSMIGKIAAGEVVERPVSAIKELIENSLDAGASAVSAEIREGGLSYIRVTDNGCGIEESDLRLAFERHATSKISREPDLFTIRTLGFRGEALASIAAVSHVVMTTRTDGTETGLKVTNEGGTIQKIEETACTVGTTITVTDLFFNTPVRKGFMRKASQEAASIHEVMTQFVLSRPDVSFRFVSDGKTVIHSPGDGRLSTAAMSVFSGNAVKTFRKVDGHANGLLLKGYVGIGDNARGNRNQEFFFINGRMMRSAVLSSALETACRERVMIGRFPVCALHIKIAYEAVDVNVHPNKLEVRFRDERQVSEAVTSLVLDALRESDAFEKPVEMLLVPDKKSTYENIPTREEILKGLQKPDAVDKKASVTVADSLPSVSPVRCSAAVKEKASSSGVEMREADTAFRPFIRPVPKTAPTPSQPEKAPDPAPSPKNVPPEHSEQISTILPEIKKTMKVFGALFNTFILVEYEDRLLLVDQHAVHERLLFDRLMAEHSVQNASQELLVPIVISVTGREQMLIDANSELLASVGLTIERFGEHEAAVRSIPMILGEAETEGFIRDLFAELDSGNGLQFEKKRTAILQTACKHAVKGGEPLTEDQLRTLLDEMIEKKVTPTCPHGRPLVVAITHRELDRKFKRIQD